MLLEYLGPSNYSVLAQLDGTVHLSNLLGQQGILEKALGNIMAPNSSALVSLSVSCLCHFANHVTLSVIQGIEGNDCNLLRLPFQLTANTNSWGVKIGLLNNVQLSSVNLTNSTGGSLSQLSANDVIQVTGSSNSTGAQVVVTTASGVFTVNFCNTTADCVDANYHCVDLGTHKDCVMTQPPPPRSPYPSPPIYGAASPPPSTPPNPPGNIATHGLSITL